MGKLTFLWVHKRSLFLCSNSKVKRVVILASSTCIANLTDTGVLDENVWNESSVKEIQEKGREAAQTDKYCAAKTLAEKGWLQSRIRRSR